MSTKGDRSGKRGPFAVGLGGVLLCLGAQASAATLEDALIQAYRTNPGLQAQREQLKTVDESYIQARSGFAPTISLQVQADYLREHQGQDTRRREAQNGLTVPDYLEQNSLNGQLVVSQPLYTSGRLAAGVSAASYDVLAGREALRAAEANLLLNVVDAYTSVQRDQQAIEIRSLNMQMLQHQVAEAEARQRAGELTRTDVAQAQAQLAAEQALFEQAKGQLEIDRARYIAVVGVAPDDLAPPPELTGVPPLYEEALGDALRNNPDLERAGLTERASKARVYAAEASGGPSLSAQIRAGYNGVADRYYGPNLNRDVNLTATLVVPLSTGGVRASQVRQAADQNSADRYTVDDTRRAVQQTMSVAWTQMLVAQAQVEAEKRQIDAARIAFEGMRKEYSNGDRSTLDVLVAEETLRDAELALVSAQHDLYVARAQVLQTMGWLEIGNMTTTDRLYRPQDNIKTRQPPLTRFMGGFILSLDRLATKDVTVQRPSWTESQAASR